MKTAILLVNLGTPDSPENKDVRKYLTEFLNDPRVIDINPISRALLVNGIIVPFRTNNSAKLYKKIWTDKGSPLMFHGVSVKEKLQARLGDNYVVELAMRYQSPSIESVLEGLKDVAKFNKIVVLPLFPQYASASTGSVHQKIMEIISKWQIVPPIHFINSYCNHPAFINAWVERTKDYALKAYDHIVFSYHGLPERQMKKADISGTHCIVNPSCCDVLNEKNQYCYKAQCYETTRKLVKALEISEGNYTVAFQSRLGRDPWIKPYTDLELKRLAAEGKKKILMFAPAFVADCLETIYEIGTEYDELFKELDGEKVQLVESLNDHPAWIDALVEIIKK